TTAHSHLPQCRLPYHLLLLRVLLLPQILPLLGSHLHPLRQAREQQETHCVDSAQQRDTCGVHHVSLVRGHDIFMLVEKEYPLTRGTLGLMMVARLLVEADSEMSKELLRKIFYQANRSRQ
ncbi:hypothetical protein Tco_0050128, partial [Tanacetum coccineum]